jgi:hypothetical protein
VLLILDNMDAVQAQQRHEFFRFAHAFETARGPGKLLWVSRHPDLSNFPSVKQHLMGAMSTADLKQFISKIAPDLHQRLTNEHVATLYRMVEGSPLLIKLVLQLLRGSKLAWDLLDTYRSSMHSEATAAKMLELILSQLSDAQRRLLAAMSTLPEVGATDRTILTMVGGDSLSNRNALSDLFARGLLQRDGNVYSLAHKRLRDVIAQTISNSVAAPGTLFLTIDLAHSSKEDVNEFLDTLNQIYVALGGKELVIRDEGIGQHLEQGVLT